MSVQSPDNNTALQWSPVQTGVTHANVNGSLGNAPIGSHNPLTGPETDVFQKSQQPPIQANSADSGYAGKEMHPVTAQTWQEIERVSTPDLFHKATVFFNALQSFCRDNDPLRT